MTTPAKPHVHPAAAAAQAAFHPDIVQEVADAVAREAVVVVGVSGLQPGRAARNLLEKEGVSFHYLEYGSYFSGWRRRLALKMWIGWPTFPLIFVHGSFVGGFSDLRRLVESGELRALLAAGRRPAN